MAILLQELYELEEKAASKLKTWKVWHIIIFTVAATCGILNYVFLFKTMQLVDNNSVLFPRALEFHVVELDIENSATENLNSIPFTRQNSSDLNEMDNVTVFTGNKTHQVMLDTSRTLFNNDDSCQYAQYMPIFSTIFGIIWICLFTMCPGGGNAKSGLQQPWRILAPAILLSLVCVGLTGYSFTTTNRGIQSFCAAFYTYTNSTTCSSVDPYIELSRSSWLGFGAWCSLTRAASAGAWASWGCAAALLLARCLVAPDFAIRKTSVYLKDPQKVLLPYLRDSKRKSSRKNSRLRENSMNSDSSQATRQVTAIVENSHLREDPLNTSIVIDAEGTSL